MLMWMMMIFYFIFLVFFSLIFFFCNRNVSPFNWISNAVPKCNICCLLLVGLCVCVCACDCRHLQELFTVCHSYWNAVNRSFKWLSYSDSVSLFSVWLITSVVLFFLFLGFVFSFCFYCCIHLFFTPITIF